MIALADQIAQSQALYTPLVSPAMTPLESQFRLPEYTIPGEYFTPLTSPALEAQHPHSSTSGFPFHARQVSDVGFVPTTTEVNPLSGASAPSSPSILRKTRRRPSAASSRLAGRASKSRQSPHIRAQTAQSQRMRGKPLAPNSEELYGHMASEMSKPPNHDVRSLQESSNEGSGQDSVSPEPLPDSLMPPPAIPPPRKSPAILPQLQPQLQSQSQQQQQQQQKPLVGAAATPATLMRLQRSQHAQESSDQVMGQAQLEVPDEIMEDISLPEAAQARPKVARIDTAVRTTASPSISAHGTPSIEPRSNPTADRTPLSVAPSPRTLAMPSPSGPVPKRSDPSRASISGRKRPSVSSTHASPLLRPKISPSIQPLMRGSDGKFFLVFFLTRPPIPSTVVKNGSIANEKGASQVCRKMHCIWLPSRIINTFWMVRFPRGSRIPKPWQRISAPSEPTTNWPSKVVGTGSTTL